MANKEVCVCPKCRRDGYYINLRKRGAEYDNFDYDILSGKKPPSVEDMLDFILTMLDDGYTIKKSKGVKV